MEAVYRVRQALAGLWAIMGPEDWVLVDRYLSPTERQLFEGMAGADQHHSVGVLRTLLAMGVEDPSLQKAALLHDVGKSRCRIGLVHRTVAVLARALLGGLPAMLTVRPDGRCWLPLFVIANHPRIGASMLARAGSEERVWRLVEMHQVEPRMVGPVRDGDWVRQALSTLQLADNQN